MMKDKKHKGFIITEFILYIFIIIFGIFFKSITPDYYKVMVQQYVDTMNWYPTVLERIWIGIHPFHMFTLVQQYIDILSHGFVNAMAFLPFGALLSCFFTEKKVKYAGIISSLFATAIEVSQLITIIGGFSIYDLIFNSLGGFAGAYLMVASTKINFAKKHVRVMLITTIFITGIALTYLMYNAFMHFDAYIAILTRNI